MPKKPPTLDYARGAGVRDRPLRSYVALAAAAICAVTGTALGFVGALPIVASAPWVVGFAATLWFAFDR